MNTYAITFRNHTENEIAETAGKAKYQFFKSHEIDDSMEFGDFVCCVSCKLVRKFRVSDLFTSDLESFDKMKKWRNIEFAYIGMKIEVNGKPGTIVGSNSGLNLNICLDGQYHVSNCHPHWRVKYLDNNENLIREYKD